MSTGLSQLSSHPWDPWCLTEAVTQMERQGPQETPGWTQALSTPGLSVSIGSWSNGGKSNPCLHTTCKTRVQRGMLKSEEDAGYLWSQAKGIEMLFLKTQRVGGTKHLKAHPCSSLQLPARCVFTEPPHTLLYAIFLSPTPNPCCDPPTALQSPPPSPIRTTFMKPSSIHVTLLIANFWCSSIACLIKSSSIN